jgi:hypothetical protein
MARKERGGIILAEICSAPDSELIEEGALAKLDLRHGPPWTPTDKG